ncbi:MAG: PP2C family serine/threonine-protein phosphatase [Chloroflexota bacterium]
MTLDIGNFTSLGVHREHNTDLTDMFVKESFDDIGGKLFILADGSGRSDYAEIATRLAVRYISRTYYSLLKRDPDMRIKDALVKAFQQANQQVYDRAYQLVSLGQMGAAVVAAVLSEDVLTVVWYGNARLYFLPFERKTAVRVTEDHTIYEVTDDDGSAMTVLPLLGTSLNPQMGVRTIDMRGGDAFVLCSDGIHGVMRPDDFTDITRNRMSVQMATRDLATEAARRGSQDNASAILVRLSSDEVADDETWSNSYDEISKLIDDLDLISDAEETREVPQQVIDRVVNAARDIRQPKIEDVLRAIDEAMPPTEEDTAQLTPGQLDRAAAEEIEAGVEPMATELNEFREVSVDDLDPEAIANFKLPFLDDEDDEEEASESTPRISESATPIRQFQQNVTLDDDLEPDDDIDLDDEDDWIEDPADFLFSIQPTEKPVPAPELIAGLEPPDEFIETDQNGFRFAPEADVALPEAPFSVEETPLEPAPQTFGADDFLSSMDDIGPEPAFLQDSGNDPNVVDFDELDSLLDAAIAGPEDTSRQSASVTLPDSFYDEDLSDTALTAETDQFAVDDVNTLGDDLIEQAMRGEQPGNNRLMRFALVFAAVLLSIAFTVLVATFLASSIREGDTPATDVAVAPADTGTTSVAGSEEDTFNKATISQPEPTERPTLTTAPTSPPTIAPPTADTRADGVPNGWVEGTILYITQQTGIRRDVFSPPLEEARFQYSVGDSVRVTLARQPAGYREWYEYNGERWWFINGLGWLNEAELSATPPQ